ncbi:MAG: penicillin acylase family protein [Candidatus Latescibacterota bacterium]
MNLSSEPETLRESLPDVTSTRHLAGLSAPVDVFRDRWGIPHIRAGSTTDLFFGQGFATAQDRLWHMDADRHKALGRWAEWVGVPGLGSDCLLRAAGMGRTAQLDYEVTSTAARAMIDAYTAGVNAFIESVTTLPIEYRLLEEGPEPWENWHCLAVYKFRNSLLGTFEPKLLRTRLAATIGPEATARMLRGYPQGHLVTVPPGEPYDGDVLDGTEALRKSAEALREAGGDPDSLVPGVGYDIDGGSNGWSVSGERTASGRPMIGGDSHRALDVPNVYYQVHLSCPDFTVIGYSVPGVPGAMHFCHNEHVAWGMTHGTADTQDLYIEKFRDGADSREYEFRNEWRRAEVRVERLLVRGADPVDLEVTITHHGPIIAGDPRRGWGVAICDPGLIEGTPWPDAVLAAMQARGVDELHAAFAEWTDRVNNYAVADTSGHFGYLHEGRIPVRDEANGWGAMPGWTGEYEWEQGMIPHDQLPKSIDPDTGWAVTCNQRVTGSGYPYYVGLYMSSEHRARRVMDRLLDLETGTADIDDMAGIHADRLTLPGRALVSRLLTALEGEALALPLQVAADTLRSWDGRMDRDAVAPAVYQATRRALIRRLVEHAFGDAVELVWANTPGTDMMARQVVLEMHLAMAGETRGDAVLPPGQTWEGLLGEAFVAGVAQLARELGDDSSRWTWGRVHHTRPTHPLAETFPEWAGLLNPSGYAVHGDADTPLAGSFTLGSFTVTALSVNRYLFDPADWTTSRWIVPGGASGHPGSPHYADQAELHADVEYIPALWDFAEIEAEAETVQRLEPSTN